MFTQSKLSWSAFLGFRFFRVSLIDTRVQRPRKRLHWTLECLHPSDLLNGREGFAIPGSEEDGALHTG